MLIKNPMMFNGRSYQKDSESNEKKLKRTLKKILDDEAHQITEKLSKVDLTKSGGSVSQNVWRGQFGSGSKSKKPKTFKL